MSPYLRRRYPRLARQMRGAWKLTDFIGAGVVAAMFIWGLCNTGGM